MGSGRIGLEIGLQWECWASLLCVISMTPDVLDEAQGWRLFLLSHCDVILSVLLLLPSCLAFEWLSSCRELGENKLHVGKWH